MNNFIFQVNNIDKQVGLVTSNRLQYVTNSIRSAPFDFPGGGAWKLGSCILYVGSQWFSTDGITSY